MKIVQIIHSYYPNVGGIEVAAQHLAEEQVRLGHQISVITASCGVNNSPREEVINGVQILRLKSIKLFYNDLIYPQEAYLPRNVDIFHIHSQTSLFSLHLAEKMKGSSGKIVFHFMAVDSHKNHPNLLLRTFAPYYSQRNTKKALKIADLPLVRSIRDLEVLKRTYHFDAQYLPDAIPNSVFFVKKSPEEFRKKFGITQKNIFVFIGRLHKLKGPRVLVEALKYLNAEFAVIFIGPDGGCLQEIIELAQKLGFSERIYILGYVDEKTKIAAIDSSVALVNPSVADHVEVYSIVLSEAWARKKPVIASRIGELSYRVKHHVNGILVEPLNPEMLAKAMMQLAGNYKLAEKMGRNGASDVFSWSTIASKSIELYSRVLKE
jgi:glycosyltransferase involved in cell wall biosynthesis